MHKAFTIGLIGLMFFLGIQHIQQEKNINEIIMMDYASFTGTIIEIRENAILVQEETNEDNSIVFNISGNVLLLDHKTKAEIMAKSFKVGQKVTTYYPENTPMALSHPPIMTPDVIVLNPDIQYGFTHVAMFDETLTSHDGRLKITLGSGMTFVDRQGKPVTNLANQALVVFYQASTRSIPAQTTPEKIIVL